MMMVKGLGDEEGFDAPPPLPFGHLPRERERKGLPTARGGDGRGGGNKENRLSISHDSIINPRGRAVMDLLHFVGYFVDLLIIEMIPQMRR